MSNPSLNDPCLPERFWRKVQMSEDQCWIWTAAKNRNGYGRFMDAEQVMRAAHRVSYEAFREAIAPGLQLDHLCRVRACVNPAHLEPVTQGENLRRGETITAKAIAATHCPAGHAYSGDNLYVTPSGERRCRACVRALNRRIRTADPERHRQQGRERSKRYRARKKLLTSAEDHPEEWRP